MRYAAALLLSLAIALPLGATAQLPDLLKIGGKTHFLHTNPLGPVLAERGDRLPDPGVHSTGLWRGYIAEWSLRDGKLYLDDVKVPQSRDEFVSAMKHLFDDAAPRVADWYTGNLIVPTGEMTRYVHSGYASTYSSYIVARVEKGMVREQRRMNEKEFETFRKAQFAKFRKTKDYADARAQVHDQEKADEFLYELASEYLSMIFEK